MIRGLFFHINFHKYICVILPHPGGSDIGACYLCAVSVPRSARPVADDRVTRPSEVYSGFKGARLKFFSCHC